MHRYRGAHARIRPLRRPGYHVWWGGTLIAAGIIVLLEHRGVITHDELWLIAPAAIAWSGLVRMALDRSAYALLAGVARLSAAAYLVVVIEHVGGWTLGATWPVLLIAVGLSSIAEAMPWRGGDAGDRDRAGETSS
jgi:hypothetical protein